jgi:hypothetical protein
MAPLPADTQALVLGANATELYRLPAADPALRRSTASRVRA